MVGNETLDSVKEYAYLGQLLTEDPNHVKGVHQRIRMGWCAYATHSQLMINDLAPSLKNTIGKY